MLSQRVSVTRFPNNSREASAMLPGSACVIRIAFEEEARRAGAPPPMLALGADLLIELSSSLLDRGTVARIDLPTDLTGLWDWPKRQLRSADDIRMAFDDLQERASDSSFDAFPVQLWFLPLDNAYKLDEAVSAFVDRPDSSDLWNGLVESGAVRISVTDDTCSLASNCEFFTTASELIAQAISKSGLALSE